MIKIMVIFVLPLELEKKENKNAEKQVAYLQICYYNYSDYGCFYFLPLPLQSKARLKQS